MEIRVTTAQANQDVKVLRLSGGLDVMTTEAALPSVLNVLAQTPGGLILDLAEMDFISSAGLRVMLALLEKAKADHKQIAIIGTQPSVYKVFKTAKLDRMFQFFDREGEAVQGLWPLP